MAQVTIAQLPQASTPLTGLELIPIVQNGVTKQATTNSLLALTSGVTSITGTANQIIASAATGAVTLSLPQNINVGASPTFSGANFSNIPNSAFTNNSLTIGTTNIALGATSLTLAGLTSVTTGSLVSNASIAGSSTVGAISIGTLSYSDTNTFESLQTSVNSYAQLILQNSSSGATASTDVVVSNNSGTASTFYANLGINSSGFTGTGAFNAPNASYLTSTSGDLAIGTTTANAIHFVVNSGTTDAMTISSAGVVTIPSLSITTATITGGTINGTSLGATTPSTGAFTTLSASSTVTLSPASANVAISPTGTGTVTINPAAASTINNTSIGVTTQAAGSFTTLAASSTVSGTGFNNLFASPPAIGGTSAAAGTFTSLTANGTVNLSPANLNVTISPTGTGTVTISPVGALTINPTAASTINNASIGATTAAAGRFTTLATTGLYTPSSTIGIAGTTTNDNAQAGSWGEFPTPTNLSAVSLTTATSVNLSSISLTAGDYEISGVIQFINAGTTTVSSIFGGISLTSATLPAAGNYLSLNATFTTGAQQQFSVPVQRFSLASTTTIYLVGQESFGVSTATGSGFLHVRRIR